MAPPTRGATPAAVPTIIAALLALSIGYLYRDTLLAMSNTWLSSESFAHGPLMPLISAWLVWRKRAELSTLPLTPWWPALLALIAAGFAWLVARLAGVNTGEQFAIVSMLPAIVALVFGWRLAWALAFPLAFVFFAVPFGEFLLPPMMELTADFTVFAVRASGVPILREGLTFELPSGRWSVVEACSGLRYLLAALPLSCVYAYLSYRSWRTRVLFVATVVLVAIVANWVRAYLIVMIGHLSDMRLAVGVDHLIYGWVFFGVVIGLSFWIGSYWVDAPDSQGAGSPPARSASGGARNAAAVAMLAAGVAGYAASAGWPAVAHELQARGAPSMSLAAVAARLDPLPDTAERHEYRPMYRGGIARTTGRLAEEPAVGVQVVHYFNQSENGEMITWHNRIVPAGPEDLTWQIRRKRTARPASLGSAFPGAPVNEYEIAGPSGRYLVWEWFSVNGRTLTDARRIKLHTAADLLRGRGDESLAWFLWSPAGDGAEAARQRLARAAGALAGASPVASVR